MSHLNRLASENRRFPTSEELIWGSEDASCRSIPSFSKFSLPIFLQNSFRLVEELGARQLSQNDMVITPSHLIVGKGTVFVQAGASDQLYCRFRNGLLS